MTADIATQPYRIFISHTDQDVNLADAVTRGIESAYGGRIAPYLAVRELMGGELWKPELKARLEESDALISIMTPESIGKPWLYIEWAAFWLAGRKFFVLLSGGVDRKDLIEPMQDSHVVDLESGSGIHKFLRALGTHAAPLPEDALHAHAARFGTEVGAARVKDVSRITERYADASVPLPDDLREKRRILEYFYNRGAADTFTEKFRTLDDDALKADLALWVSRRNDLALTVVLGEEIGGADHLCRVARGMIRAGHQDTPELRRLLDIIQSRNNAELRKLALEVLQGSHADAAVFRYMAGIIDNMAELRKVGMCLVERGDFERPIFGEIVEKIRRRSIVHLREIAMEFVRQGTQRAPELTRIMDVAVQEKPAVAVSVMEELRTRDPAMLPPLLERHDHLGADNAAVAWLRKELGRE